MNILKQNKRSRKTSTTLISDVDKWKPNKTISILAKDVSDVEESSDGHSIDTVGSIDWEREFFTHKEVLSDISEQDQEIILTKKQTLILATMVPNELLKMGEFENANNFVGVLLMADVSGFTALSERYHSTGKSGAYRLTMTLNTYLGSLVELIYSHGGDVVKFAGDAFLALWKVDKKSFLNHTIHTAIACSLIIQHLYSSYETDVKVNLKVKLAISAGNLIFALVGSGIDKSYVLTGLPVFEAKDAESVCSSGEVKLSATAWAHCYSRNYDHIIHEDGHVTIRSILYDPRDQDVSKPFSGLGSLIRQSKKQFSAIENLPKDLWDEQITPNVMESLKINETLTLRETILESIEKSDGATIRKFMIRPVVQQIDAHQPLEYLTEMRYVTIMFVTLKPHKCPVMQLITIVNKAYEITCDMVYKSMGCVNKIILFDKDVMILVIFGLRGFKHESEAQAALKSAYSIQKSLSALDGVLQVSIGVTTGQVYCGVVGHPLRREFTVIGSIVNKAARLMCYFRNKITCDDATYIKSKMSANSFTLQPSIQLKGIAQTGKIYEYTEELRMKEFHNIPIIAPLLNRHNEMEIFDYCINNFGRKRDYDTILLVGENRIGKTRLLEWMARQGKSKGLQICHINLSSIHSATSYLAVNQIVNYLLKVSEPVKDFVKEERIVHLLNAYNEDLCYLNKVIKTRFAYHEVVYTQNSDIRNEHAKQMFKQLIEAINERFLICIDDLHNLDPLSWEFISIILKSPKIFIILTITKEKINSELTWQHDVFTNQNIKKIILGPLNPDLVAPLACQILDVDAVPKDLHDALQSKCKCKPGLIESFIVHLFSSGALEIKKIVNNEFDDMDKSELHIPNSKILTPVALSKSNQNTLEELMAIEATEEKKVCFVINKNELDTNINTQSADALIIMQIDSLTPYQQLLLKIASVVGSVVSRDLLENIMYENNHIITAKAIKRLFAMKLLSCANNRIRWSRKTFSDPSSACLTMMSFCDCTFEFDEDNSYNLPKYAFCKLMKFKNKRSRKTCYELLPLNQKKEFHTRIMNYLENHKPKCSDCGGVILIVQSFSQNRSSFIGEDNLYGENRTINGNFSSTEHVINEHLLLRPQPSISSIREPSICKRIPDLQKIDTNFKNSNISVYHNSTTSINLFHHASILKSRCDINSSSLMQRRSTKRVTMPSIMFKELSFKELQDDQIFSKIRVVAEADDLKAWEDLGFKDNDTDNNYLSVNNKKSYMIHLERGTSQTNFKRCTCAQLQILIYEQLIHHAIEADLKIKAIEFQIKYCKLNISHNVLKDIWGHLDEAENKCTELYNSAEKLNKFDRKRLLGKIYTLKAATNIMVSDFSNAELEILKAIKIYGINLNRLSTHFQVRNKNRKLRGNNAILGIDSVSCLNVSTILYNTIGDQTLARVCAYRAIALLRRVDCCVSQICDAYSNAIQVELDRGSPEATEPIERAAQESLKNLPNSVKPGEVFEIGKLYLVSFRARIARGLLPSSIRSGLRCLVLSRFVFANDVSLEIIPDLFYVLMSKRYVTEAVDVLTELLRMCENKNNVQFETWYYALCLDMILDAGFQIEFPANIIRFADHILFKGDTNTPGWRRLSVGLWVYYLRSETERKAKLWEGEAMKWAQYEGNLNSLTHLISGLRLAEGMLESLSRKVDDLRKVVDLMELRSLADRELNKMEKDVRLCRTIMPRWLLLRASCAKLSGRHSQSISYATQANEVAKRIQNYLELARAIPSTSQQWIESARAGCFVDWQEANEKQVRTEWYRLVYRLTTKLN